MAWKSYGGAKAGLLWLKNYNESLLNSSSSESSKKTTILNHSNLLIPLQTHIFHSINTHLTAFMPSLTTQIHAQTRTSSTTTATQTQTTSIPDPSLSPPIVTLRLRAEPAHSRRIRWAEDVVDNEGLGRKKSKGLQRNLTYYSSMQIITDMEI